MLRTPLSSNLSFRAQQNCPVEGRFCEVENLLFALGPDADRLLDHSPLRSLNKPDQHVHILAPIRL